MPDRNGAQDDTTKMSALADGAPPARASPRIGRRDSAPPQSSTNALRRGILGIDGPTRVRLTRGAREEVLRRPWEKTLAFDPDAQVEFIRRRRPPPPQLPHNRKD